MREAGTPRGLFRIRSHVIYCTLAVAGTLIRVGAVKSINSTLWSRHSSEVEEKLHRKMPVRARGLLQTGLLCSLCDGDVYVCICVRKGNGPPQARRKSEVTVYRRKSRARGGEEREEREHRAAFLISSEISLFWQLIIVHSRLYLSAFSSARGRALRWLLLRPIPVFWQYLSQCVWLARGCADANVEF